MAARLKRYGLTAEVERKRDAKYNEVLGKTSLIQLDSTARHFLSLNFEESYRQLSDQSYLCL